MTEKKTHKTTDSARKNTNPAELAPSTILSMVGEGGGYTIEGHQRKGQWQFRLVISSASHLVNEEDDPGTQAVRGESALPEWQTHLDAVFAQINSGWPHLYPLTMHRLFADAIWARVEAIHAEGALPDLVLGRWRKACYDAGAALSALRSEPGWIIQSPPDIPAKTSWQAPDFWMPLQDGLATALARMKEDEYLILLVKGSNRYVQFAAQGDSGLRVESTSNYFLLGDDKLSESQHARLLSLGWKAPTGNPQEATPQLQPMGSANYFVDVPASVEIGAVLELTLRTLLDVHQAPYPGALQYQAFDADGNHYPLPALPIKHHLRDSSASIAQTADRLLATFRAALDKPELDFDAEGSLWLPCDSLRNEVPVRVWLTERPMLVHFSYAILKIESETEAMIRHVFNDFNIKHGPLRFVVDEDLGWIHMEVFAEPFVAEQIVKAYIYFDEAATGFLDVLSAEPLSNATH